jgi:hypothetical protein
MWIRQCCLPARSAMKIFDKLYALSTIAQAQDDGQAVSRGNRGERAQHEHETLFGSDDLVPLHGQWIDDAADSLALFDRLPQRDGRFEKAGGRRGTPALHVARVGTRIFNHVLHPRGRRHPVEHAQQSHHIETAGCSSLRVEPATDLRVHTGQAFGRSCGKFFPKRPQPRGEGHWGKELRRVGWRDSNPQMAG